MSFPVPPRQFDHSKPEMIDNPAADPVLLKNELKSIRTINRFFGGFSAVRRGVLRLADKAPASTEMRILDLGTGSADIPAYLLRLGRRIHRTFHVTAVDAHPVVLQIARDRARTFPNLTIEQANLLELKYAPRTFDIVLCSLTLHHFSSEEIIAILGSMKRLCRIGFVVNDLRRSKVAIWTTWLYTHLTTSNEMTLKDSHLSVTRGFTADELRELAVQAGIRRFIIWRQAFFRLLLIGEPD